MNIFTVIIGIYILFKGISKMFSAFLLSAEVNEYSKNGSKLDKFNYYMVKINQVLEPISKFFVGLFVIIVGAKFIWLGVKGISTVPLIRSIAKLFLEIINFVVQNPTI